MSKKLFNQESFNQQLIIAGCAGLVSKEGLTTREVFELLDEMKGQLWTALNQMEEEKRNEEG